MTLAMAWTRKVNKTQELVFVSDSRLRGGRSWDCGPKLLLLPRTDCLICFAGETHDAYPLMLQIRNEIEMHEESRKRIYPLSELKGNILRVFNHMRSYIHDLPSGQMFPDDPDAQFIFGGYCWKNKKFLIWKLHYKPSEKIFTFHPVRRWKGGGGLKMICFAGDKDVVIDAKKRLIEKLREKNMLNEGNLDMEPFEVLRDIIREEAFYSVGGAPQLVKIYEHMNTLPFAMFWPKKESDKVFGLGRELSHKEIGDWVVLDPDDIDFTKRIILPEKTI